MERRVIKFYREHRGQRRGSFSRYYDQDVAGSFIACARLLRSCVIMRLVHQVAGR